jgi:BirA family biotin operon repressor/biotin-[acetyl-CoA-carboxylase] ligase
LRYPATSLLLASGQRVARVKFCQILLKELDQLYRRYLVEGFAPIRSGWEGYFSLVGSRVSVDCTSRVIDGRVIGIDSDGALLLQRIDGGTERILAGDVRPLD